MSQSDKSLPLEVDDLRRFLYDLKGIKISLSEIDKIKAESKYIHEPIDTAYELTREEGMRSFMEQFAKMYAFWKKKGVDAADPFTGPTRMLVEFTRFNLDVGLTYLHYYAFLPALEQLASVEQAKKWVPLARAFQIIGAYS